MNNIIYKYDIKIEDIYEIELPIHAEILNHRRDNEYFLTQLKGLENA